MKLTPLDIHHKEFRTSLRGYSEKEVDAFLDEVADEFDRLFKENVDLNERIQATLERIKSYEDMKETLQNTLVVAQTHAESMEVDAGKRSELLMREADLKAQQIVADALAEKQRVQQEVMRIRRAGEQYREALALMLERHLHEVSDVEVPADFPSEEDIVESRNDLLEASGAVRPTAPPSAPTYAAAVAQAEEVVPAPSFEQAAPVAPAVPAASAPITAEPARTAPPAPVAPRTQEPFAPAAPSQFPPVTTQMPTSGPAPIAGLEPSFPDSASSLTLGEVAPPALPDNGIPVFTDPAEFELPSFGSGFGQADDDVDIEEID